MESERPSFLQAHYNRAMEASDDPVGDHVIYCLWNDISDDHGAKLKAGYEKWKQWKNSAPAPKKND